MATRRGHWAGEIAAGLARGRHVAALGLLLVGLAVGVDGCAAPTLPLPPPAALAATSPDPTTGLVVVTGEVLPEAYVSCLNPRIETGVIVRADAAGRFQLEIAARAGDSLLVWQQRGNDFGPYAELCIDCTVRDR
jgi:hypothetical protein